jgi:hypothetical protein
MPSRAVRLAIPLLLLAGCTGRKAAASESPPPPAPLRCEGPAGAAAPQARGNPAARKAAQAGLGHRSRAAIAWTDQHKCFGCHVQAVAETPFVHDTLAARHARYGEIEGNLGLQGGAGVSANTVVELVDRDGNVLQRVVSTEQGNYRFKDVASGEYRVRTRKEGFADQELSVRSAPASAPVKADMLLK